MKYPKGFITIGTCTTCGAGGRIHALNKCQKCYHAAQYKANIVEERAKRRVSGGKYYKTIRGRFNHSKITAKRRGFSFTLTEEEYSLLLGKKCFYCSGKLDPTGGGLDRIDNAKGYDVTNVVPCCGRCNRVRNSLITMGEMLEVSALLKKLRNDEEEHEPFVIENDNTVCYDCDDTLAIWDIPESEVGNAIDIGVGLYTAKILPHKKHIQSVKNAKARGHYVIIWSAGGSAWGTELVRALGLIPYVDMVMVKPRWIYDDIPASEWMPKPFYFPLK